MMVPTLCEGININELADVERLLLCPITDEINDELMISVDPDFLGLDPQGLTRNITSNHVVNSKTWCNSAVLKKLDLLKTSSYEHHLITGQKDVYKSLRRLLKWGVKTCVITDGSSGSFVMTESDYFRVPIYPVDVVDVTGAGDTFIAGLAAYFNEELKWACAIASASSSAIVETQGPEIICKRAEIYRRSEQIYEKIELLG